MTHVFNRGRYRFPFWRRLDTAAQKRIATAAARRHELQQRYEALAAVNPVVTCTRCGKQVPVEKAVVDGDGVAHGACLKAKR